MNRQGVMNRTESTRGEEVRRDSECSGGESVTVRESEGVECEGSGE